MRPISNNLNTIQREPVKAPSLFQKSLQALAMIALGFPPVAAPAAAFAGSENNNIIQINKSPEVLHAQHREVARSLAL